MGCMFHDGMRLTSCNDNAAAHCPEVLKSLQIRSLWASFWVLSYD